MLVLRAGRPVEVSDKELANVPHKVLVDETDKGPKRARLLVNALAFGWLNGLTEECHMMADELVKLRPDFSVQWEQILEDFGR